MGQEARLIRAGILSALLLGTAGPALSQAPSPPGAPASGPAPTRAPAGREGALPASAAQGARLFEGLGSYHREVTTQVPEAQAYFDQGLRFVYAFNHDEAFRSFARAAELDPSCAMCFWGAALVLGPNYNMPMMPDRAKMAWSALQEAQRLKPQASPVERALIDALSARYRGPEPLEPPAQQRNNEAYATRMREVAKRFPQDLDVQTLYAESMMDLNPWKLWSLDGKPAPGTLEIVSTLEGVLRASPDHPGANHYYIHAVEASTSPERALASADRLGSLMPSAGHVVHMPSHIYLRVGRYEKASEANREALEADRKYLPQAPQGSLYSMYPSHNAGFLAHTASMEGRAKEALAAAKEAADLIDPHMVQMMPGMDFFLSPPLFTQLRFGRWNEVLATPAPDPRQQVLTGVWHYARGAALAAQGCPDDAQNELAALNSIRRALPAKAMAGQNPAKDVLTLAATVLEGNIAAARGQDAQAIARLQKAARIEDTLAYNEPPDWFYPVRHELGALLLRADRPKEAEAVYLEDLRRHPDNGWALLGLSQALAATGRADEAARVRVRFQDAWERADTPIKTSAFLGATPQRGSTGG
ncbi:hypothetical protein P2318_23115 [Myxococcaceae bacterium GXIMD 01537]